MADHGEIHRAIREFILAQFPAARKRGLGESDSLLEHGVIDSLGVLDIVTFIEREFGVTLADEEMLADHFDSIDSMAALVHRKLELEGSQWTS